MCRKILLFFAVSLYPLSFFANTPFKAVCAETDQIYAHIAQFEYASALHTMSYKYARSKAGTFIFKLYFNSKFLCELEQIVLQILLAYLLFFSHADKIFIVIIKVE